MSCGERIEDVDSGFITSPDYPEDYPPNQTCWWNITVPAGSKIELEILDLKVCLSFIINRSICVHRGGSKPPPQKKP
jgi:hypothetical protein